MCSITAHDNQQHTYIDDSGSGSGRGIPKNATTAALESLGTA